MEISDEPTPEIPCPVCHLPVLPLTGWCIYCNITILDVLMLGPMPVNTAKGDAESFEVDIAY